MASRAILKSEREHASYPSLVRADSAEAAGQLAAAFGTQSPRVVPFRTPLHAYLIYAAVLFFWLVLTGAAFVAQGVFAWSIGVAYIAYDTALIGFVATRIVALLRPPTEMALPRERPSVGIIVAAWNEARALPGTLQALHAQDDAPDLIIVADDGSDDATIDAMRADYGLPAPPLGTLSPPSPIVPSLHWLRLPHRGKAHALNAALAHAATDIVITVDADTLLVPDAIAVVRRDFAADPNLVVGGGILTPVCERTISGRFLAFFQRYEYIRNFMSRYAWSRVDALLLISGAFAAFRRDAVMTVGGFDPNSFVEDYELIHRLQRFSRADALGWRVRILGRARATTGAPGRVPTFLRQRRRWFAGFLQTQFWHRDMTGTRRFGALGLAMMPVKALDTLQPIYGLTALLLLPYFIATGRAGLLVPAFGIMSGKILVDLAYYFGCIALYRRWTGDHATRAGPHALFAAVAEPFVFQPLRHLGATWGWFALLTGDRRWGKPRTQAPVEGGD